MFETRMELAERMLRQARMDYEQAKLCEAAYVRGRLLAKEILDQRQREFDMAQREERERRSLCQPSHS
jgi:hypothetical protein